MNKKKYILLLGGAGFLGRNIIEYYKSTLEKKIEEEYLFILVGRSNNIEIPSTIYIKLDYTDNNVLRSIFKKYKIDEVFHFISTSIPATSNNNIIEDVKSNLLGTIALLELMKEYQVKKISYLSSGGTIYGEKKVNEFQEDTISSPNNSYGVLKIAIENYIKLYNKMFGIEYLILRISNPFGKFHNSSKNGLINIAIRKAILNEPIQIWGDGTSLKDYIFASDFARIFWFLNLNYSCNEIINLGSGNNYSINEILLNIKKLIPTTTWEYLDEKEFDTKNSLFSISKLKCKNNFENTPLSKAIEETYQWELNRYSIKK
jgi:UDP-glucose 4-epimerase